MSQGAYRTASEISTPHTKLSVLQSISYRQHLTCSLGKTTKQKIKSDLLDLLGFCLVALVDFGVLGGRLEVIENILNNRCFISKCN